MGSVLGSDGNNVELKGLRHELRRLYTHLSHARRKALRRVLGLSVISGFAEIATLGALVPFLTLLADRSRIPDSTLSRVIMRGLASIDANNIMIGATILVVVAAVISGALRILLAWTSQRFVHGMGHDLTMAVLDRSLHQPYSYHVATNSSELIAGVNKVQLLAMRMLLPLMQVATSLVTIVLVFSALAFIHPPIAIGAGISLGVAYLIVGISAKRTLRKNSAIIAGAQAARIQTVQEGMGGIRDILLDRTQEYLLTKFDALDRAVRDARLENTIIAAVPRFLVEAAAIVAIVGVAFYFSRQEGGLNAAIPILGVLALGVQRILPALQGMYASWAQIKGSHHMLSDLLAMLNLPISAQNNSEKAGTLPFEQEIRLSGVSFRYPERQNAILKDVSLTVEKGARIGLIGRTGSGKSTLADIVMGLLEPVAGEMSVDGTTIDRGNIRNWQNRVAYVAQNVYLTDASLAQNIAFCVAEEQVDWHRMEEAIQRASLSEFVANQPDGLATIIGERGVRLSGGQRQRIGIARAIYKQADLLVFDEATSALDEFTESKVFDAIQSLDQHVTIITIAHRARSIDWCDQIWRVEDGVLSQIDPL